MPQIIPAIIAKNLKELEKKLKLVEPFFSMFQLDVMDGKFVKNETISDISQILEIKTFLEWEIHLMAESPMDKVGLWAAIKPKRFIFHYESANPEDMKTIIQKIKLFGMEAGIALNPETPVVAIENLLPELDVVLLMSVNPGFGGQEFIEDVLLKISALRQMWPNGIIEVDGGIKKDIFKKCVEAGADILVAGSLIFEAEDIKKIIDDFKKEL